MKNLKKSHLILIIVSVLILSGCIGITAYLLLSNYQSIRLFKQAQDNFRRGDPASMELAEAQLLQVIRVDEDNESAYIMLGAIAEKKQIYPEQVYYCHMACRLNPLSEKNRKQYIRSLCFARYFDRLENFLTQLTELNAADEQLLLYAAARNSNLDKYKQRFKKVKDDFSIAGLAHFLYDRSSINEKLEKLKKFPVDDPLLKQEILVSSVELYLDLNDPVNAGRVLEEAYVLNQFAFAPALGRFYANFDSFGKALPIFEKYLKTYHDQAVAIQTAEIYCLLKQTGKIAKLREQYQSDPGNSGMLCCYYFDALTALAKNDMETLKELTVPLRKNISTPLAAFMFLCADLQSNDLSAIKDSYNSLLGHRNYLNLQSRADKMISSYLKKALNQPMQNEENLLALANLLYKRNAEPFIAKLILLLQKKRNAVNVTLLNDAMKRFSKDHGIVKIAIEYFISQDFVRCRELINYYKKSFPAKKDNMLRYEIILAMRRQDFEQVSQLFQKNFDRDVHAQYWEFASSFMWEKDLLFLSKDRLYSPFCKALLLLKKGKKMPLVIFWKKPTPKTIQPCFSLQQKLLERTAETVQLWKDMPVFRQIRHIGSLYC